MMDEKNNLFWQLIEPEHLKARGFCRKLAGNRDDGDDLYQDSLVAALKGFGKLQSHEAVKSWLYRIIINRYKNSTRSKWRQIIAPLTGEVEQASGTNPGEVYSARRYLESAFKKISDEERALISLFEIEGWSLKELAEIFKQSEGSIKVRLSRIRMKMRQALLKKHPSKKDSELKTLKNKDTLCVVNKPGRN